MIRTWTCRKCKARNPRRYAKCQTVLPMAADCITRGDHEWYRPDPCAPVRVCSRCGVSVADWKRGRMG